MTVGNSQTCGKQITGILTFSLKPDPTTSIAPGLAVVNISATDDELVGLPTSSARLLNGRSFAGVSVGFNATAIAATNQPAAQLCTACFTGTYPIELPSHDKLGKGLLEMQLPMDLASS